jgi:hypothetical protein
MRTSGNATIAEKIGSRSHIDFELGIRNMPAANALPACEFGPNIGAERESNLSIVRRRISRPEIPRSTETASATIEATSASAPDRKNSSTE